MVSLTITLIILGRSRLHRLDAFQQKQTRHQRRHAARSAGAGAGRDAARPDVPVYLDGVGTVRALNTVTVRAQVDGKLIEVEFNEGQDVKTRPRAGARSIPPPTRRNTIRRSPRRRRTRPRSPTRGSISTATAAGRVQFGSKQQADTQQRHWWRSSKRRSSSTRLRSTTSGDPRYTNITAPIDGPHRHPPGR